ncbi:MAG: hypothetical protein WCQ63_03755 [Methanomethylophilus sp.]
MVVSVWAAVVLVVLTVAVAGGFVAAVLTGQDTETDDIGGSFDAAQLPFVVTDHRVAVIGGGNNGTPGGNAFYGGWADLDPGDIVLIAAVPANVTVFAQQLRACLEAGHAVLSVAGADVFAAASFTVDFIAGAEVCGLYIDPVTGTVVGISFSSTHYSDLAAQMYSWADGIMPHGPVAWAGSRACI